MAWHGRLDRIYKSSEKGKKEKKGKSTSTTILQLFYCTCSRAIAVDYSNTVHVIVKERKTDKKLSIADE
jgi:hypothetical protein